MSQAPGQTATIERLLSSEVTQSRSGMANLFAQSPVAIMEQDYRSLIDWMDARRAEGLVDLDGFLVNNPDIIPELAYMIVVSAVNPAASRMVGLDATEIVGPIRPSMVDAGSTPSWVRQIRLVWNGETAGEAVFEGTRADGSTFDGLLAISVPTPFGIPDYSRVVVSMIDISTQRLEERRIKNLVDAKNRLLIDATREMHTPMNAVLGFVETLKTTDPADGPGREQIIGDIAEKAGDVRSVIEDLLVSSRVELGELQAANVPCDLSAQVAQVLEAGGAAMEKVLTPNRQVEDRIAVADPAWVRQIIRNLVSNALRYGGPEVIVKIRRRVGTLFVAVVDDGVGLSRIDEERLSHRADPPEKTPIGMGLAVAHELAHLMDGDLTYRRESGRSVFELSLPAQSD